MKWKRETPAALGSPEYAAAELNFTLLKCSGGTQVGRLPIPFPAEFLVLGRQADQQPTKALLGLPAAKLLGCLTLP